MVGTQREPSENIHALIHRAQPDEAQALTDLMHCSKLTRSLGFCELSFESDPYAEGFNLKMGAVNVGQSESRIIKGRFIPQMIFRLPDCL